MRNSTTARISCWIFSLALGGVPAFAELRLGENVRPTFEAVHLTLDAREREYSGSVSIELEVREPADRFRFHSEGHDIRRLVLTGSGGEVAVEHEAEGEDTVLVRARGPLAAGRYTLAIDFDAAFGTRATGLYRVEDDSAAYVFSMFWPADAREAFPCWDEPDFKIPFQLTLTVPDGHAAVTNAPEEEARAADGWRTVTFRRSRPLPTYDVAIATGPLETVPIPGLKVPGRIVTVRGRGHLTADAVAVTPPILDALEEYFERPHPYAKVDLIAVPRFSGGAMENPGAVTFREGLLLLDPDSASAADRRSQASVIAHELAHMWFGNLVTIAWWDDFWLSEAFATWMGNKVTRQVFPEMGTEPERLRRVYTAMEIDARRTSLPIRRDVAAPDELMVTGALTYNKGAQVLGMFERFLGADRFRQGVLAYLQSHAWGNARAEDLWRALDRSSDENVSAAIAGFLEQPGLPLVEVELRDGRLHLRQQRFTAGGAEPGGEWSWRVPVALKLRGEDGSRIETVLLEGGSWSAPAGVTSGGVAPGAVFPNAGAAGYYRWSLPVGELRALAEEADVFLEPRERLDLLANATALLRSGRLPGDVYLAVLEELADDPDPAVLVALTDALDTVKQTFVTEELEDAFASYLRRVLAPAMERVGFGGEDQDDGPLAEARGELYLRLGRDGHDENVRGHAREAVRVFLEGGEVTPELVVPALEVAASAGDSELFAAYRKRLPAASNPAELRGLALALAVFPSAELRRQVLDDVLRGTFRLTDLREMVFDPARGGAAAAEQRYRWLKENYEALKPQLPPIFLTFLPRLAGGCSAERLADAEGFFSEPEHSVPGTGTQLALVAGEVRGCVALRQREGEAVARYLARASGR